MTREEAARGFAAAMSEPGMSWRYVEGGSVSFPGAYFERAGGDAGDVRLPYVGSSLPAHLAFVGRVAEALGPDFFLSEITRAGSVWLVDFQSTKTPSPGTDGGGCGRSADLSHAALLAATAARRGRSG